jgi:hypothetical protein
MIPDRAAWIKGLAANGRKWRGSGRERGAKSAQAIGVYGADVDVIIAEIIALRNPFDAPIRTTAACQARRLLGGSIRS